MESRTDVDALKPGDHLYEVSYYVVESVDDEYVNVVLPVTNASMKISRDIVREQIYTTDQYASEQKMTRSELAQKIETLGHAAFRVTFRKQVSANDVADGLNGADLGSQAKRRKLVKTLMEGEERVMHARLLRSKEFDASMEFGRYKVIDLKQFDETGDIGRSTRLVDTRTVSELIVDNVRYYV